MLVSAIDNTQDQNGVRGGSDAFIATDRDALYADGAKFSLSSQGVVLTEGLTYRHENRPRQQLVGIPPKYLIEAREISTGRLMTLGDAPPERQGGWELQEEIQVTETQVEAIRKALPCCGEESSDFASRGATSAEESDSVCFEEPLQEQEKAPFCKSTPDGEDIDVWKLLERSSSHAQPPDAPSTPDGGGKERITEGPYGPIWGDESDID